MSNHPLDLLAQLPDIDSRAERFYSGGREGQVIVREGHRPAVRTGAMPLFSATKSV